MKLAELQEVLRRVQEEAAAPEAPYDDLYHAAEELESKIKALEGRGQAVPLKLASLHCQRGCILLETDLLADGEAAIRKGLVALEKACRVAVTQDDASVNDASTRDSVDTQYWVQLQSAYNALGALYSQRGDFPAALAWLSKAEAMVATPPTAALGEALQPGLTTTLFYLAQVHGHANNKERSAHYCGETLRRQYKSGQLDCTDWCQNALQLADFYMSQNAFSAAESLLGAAAHVQSSSAQRTQDSPVLDERMQANMHLAWAKLCRQRLYVSHQRQMGKAIRIPGYDEAPAMLAPQIVPELQSQTAPSGVPGDFSAAREIFNTAMQHYNAALTYYKMDGFVTEHVGILLDISSILMFLASFEAEPTRCAAIHKLRTARLTSVCGDCLSSEHYLPQIRAVELECANAWRDCLDARETLAADTKAQILAAQASVRHYQAYLSTFQLPVGGRVDSGEEDTFLSASFALGRVLQRLSGLVQGQDRQAEFLRQARQQMLWSSKYVRQHSVTSYAQEGALAEELAGLLLEKSKLLQRLK